MFDVESLSRLQFALTSIYHWLFVPFTLGMTCLVALLEIAYVNTKDELYRKMAKFWGGLFLINFAMGVVTGIVQEFHFGMNWSEYSRFMGDIFGAPLALEALTAFFLESTFMGAWIFGWNRLSPKAHAFTAVLVAIGSNLSAFWILVANSFMQNPVGYVLRNGRAELDNFGAVIGNTYAHFQFAHIFTDGILFAGTIMMAISAWNLLRKKDIEFYKRSVKWGVVTAIIGAVLVMGVGHMFGQYVTKTQPMKIAAVEALWKTADPAPFSIISGIDQANQKNTFELAIPGGLSFLTQNSFTKGQVKGMIDLNQEMQITHGPGDYIPQDVTAIFYTFRIMAGFGGILLLVAAIGYWRVRKDTIVESPGVLKALFWSLPLVYIANSCGWYVAEAGRQPWLVYGLQLTKDGVSKAITAGDVLLTVIGFTAVYVVAAIAAIYLAVKHIKKGPNGPDNHDVVDTKKEATLWN